MTKVARSDFEDLKWYPPQELALAMSVLFSTEFGAASEPIAANGRQSFALHLSRGIKMYTIEA